MVYVERMRRALTGRTGDWLARNSWPRLVVLGSYGVAASCAYQASISLEHLGVENLTARLSLGFLIAYICYVVLIGIWLRLMPTLQHQTLIQNAPAEIETRSPSEGGHEWMDQATDQARITIQRDARGVVGLVVGLAILGIVFLLGHWLLHARWYLAELMVLSGKVPHRSIRNRRRDSWVREPFRQSFWMAFGLLLHFMLIGQLLSTQIA